MVEGRPADEAHWAANALVNGGYFAAMGIPIVRGRTFLDSDTPEEKRPAAIVNQALASHYWPGENPLGKGLVWGNRRLIVVGLAGDVHTKALDDAVEPTIYTSVMQLESGAATSAVFVLRTHSNDSSLFSAAVKTAIWSSDQGLPVFGVEALSQVVGNSLATRRIAVILLGSFSFLALGLAVVGLYGLLSYTVVQRTREIGVRVALGAKPGAVSGLFLRQGLLLSSGGIAIGLIPAFIAATLMSKLLFGIRVFDPVAFLVGVIVLPATAAAASYIPARRASRIDPLEALRSE